MAKTDPYAAQEAQLKRMEQKRQYENKKPEEFQVPKWMLEDNHPETTGKGSPGASGKTKTGSSGKKKGKWKKMLDKRKEQHSQ